MDDRGRQVWREPPEACDDLTFARRLYLDVLGRVPSVSELRDLQDLGDNRRKMLVEYLVFGEGPRAATCPARRTVRRSHVGRRGRSKPGFALGQFPHGEFLVRGTGSGLVDLANGFARARFAGVDISKVNIARNSANDRADSEPAAKIEWIESELLPVKPNEGEDTAEPSEANQAVPDPITSNSLDGFLSRHVLLRESE